MDDIQELQKALTAMDKARLLDAAKTGLTKKGEMLLRRALFQLDIMQEALKEIADQNPPLSAFRSRYGDIEAYENSDNYGDVAMAATYRMAAMIGDKARAALAHTAPTTAPRQS